MAKKNTEAFELSEDIKAQLKELFASPRGYKILIVGEDGSIYNVVKEAKEHAKLHKVKMMAIDQELKITEFNSELESTEEKTA